MDDVRFNQAIEAVKLRVPIEDAVRDRVPELKRAGRLLAACCPFHEEKTPSFKVDPTRGTWHCFGACSTGGDVISFVQRFDGLSFRDALALLARAAGVELPAWGGRADRGESERLYRALEYAEGVYRRVLAGPSGAEARAYLERRGLDPGAVEAFGLGFSPPSGNPLTEAASGDAGALQAALATGLVRRGEDRTYDFFHGRLMIPIRDRLGRTVGFGARSLGSGDESGPKYVNTPQTALFNKGRLIYGLDRATEHVRRGRHLVLVEGYTDVIAAHQVGLGQVVAVLGTALTDDHAKLIRATGARRVTLVFDGDEAGRAATFRALAGLLPVGLELDVVRLEGGADPCELVVEAGERALAERFESATPWFDFALEGLDALDGEALSAGVDDVLRLIARLGKPVERESRTARLASELDLPAEVVREQARGLFGRGARRATGRVVGATRAAAAARPESGGEAGPEEPAADRRRELQAYRELAGAALLDNSLIPAVSGHFGGCPDEALAHVLNTVLELYEHDEDDAVIDAGRVLAALADHPARELVVTLDEHARRAEAPRLLAEGAVACLQDLRVRRSLDERAREHATAEDADARSRQLLAFWKEMRRAKGPSSGSDAAAAVR